jgi:hypothetical protein
MCPDCPLFEVEFYYDGETIGLLYNLQYHQVGRLLDEWHSYGEHYTATVLFEQEQEEE